MGEAKNSDLRVSFDSRVKLKFLGSNVTTDADLLAYRELDETLGLTEMGTDELTALRLATTNSISLCHCFVSRSTADWQAMKT